MVIQPDGLTGRQVGLVQSLSKTARLAPRDARRDRLTAGCVPASEGTKTKLIVVRIRAGPSLKDTAAPYTGLPDFPSHRAPLSSMRTRSRSLTQPWQDAEARDADGAAHLGRPLEYRTTGLSVTRWGAILLLIPAPCWPSGVGTNRTNPSRPSRSKIRRPALCRGGDREDPHSTRPSAMCALSILVSTHRSKSARSSKALI